MSPKRAVWEIKLFHSKFKFKPETGKFVNSSFEILESDCTGLPGVWNLHVQMLVEVVYATYGGQLLRGMLLSIGVAQLVIQLSTTCGAQPFSLLCYHEVMR